MTHPGRRSDPHPTRDHAAVPAVNVALGAPRRPNVTLTAIHAANVALGPRRPPNVTLTAGTPGGCRVWT